MSYGIEQKQLRKNRPLFLDAIKEEHVNYAQRGR